MSDCLVALPVRADIEVQTFVQWDRFGLIFDDASGNPIDFTGQTFSGEALTEPGGKKLFDLSFNTPANDGLIQPILTDAQTQLLVGEKKAWYFVAVTSDAKRPWYSGEINVSKDYQPGA